MSYILDITTNTDYTDDLSRNIIGIKAKKVFVTDIEFKTIIDEHWTGNEQRRAQWSVPRRSWSFEFEKTPSNAIKMQNLFTNVKGKFKAFTVIIPKLDSDGLVFSGEETAEFTIRFDMDKLAINVQEMGYKTFKVDVIQVFDTV
jgi:hypothetical protein